MRTALRAADRELSVEVGGLSAIFVLSGFSRALKHVLNAHFGFESVIPTQPAFAVSWLELLSGSCSPLSSSYWSSLSVNVFHH